MATKPIHYEKRKSVRRQVLGGGRITVPDGSIMEKCLVVDMSEGGARLEVKKADELPESFLLLLSHDGRLNRHCSVVWRQGSSVGVKFVSHVPPGETAETGTVTNDPDTVKGGG